MHKGSRMARAGGLIGSVGLIMALSTPTMAASYTPSASIGFNASKATVRAQVARTLGSYAASRLLTQVVAIPNQSQFKGASYRYDNYTTDRTFNSSSGNWTGKAVANSGALGVAGAFTAESYSGPSDNTFGSWVGLGGNPYSNGGGTELLQAGYGKNEAKGDLWAFVETNPNSNATYLFPVNPGDIVGSVISRVSPGAWEVTVEDETTGNYWSNEYSMSVDRSSADWITETSPGEVGTWNPVQFTGCSWIDSSNNDVNINSGQDNTLDTFYVSYAFLQGATSVSGISGGDAFTTYDHS